MVCEERISNAEDEIQKANAKMEIARDMARNGLYERYDTFTEEETIVNGPVRD